MSQRSLDQAMAAYESASNTVSYSKTQLNLATRDLEKTNLSAPFDAVIAARHVEPFQEVKRGQPISAEVNLVLSANDEETGFLIPFANKDQKSAGR